MLTGAAGQIGSELSEALRHAGHETQAFRREELDITDPGAVERAVAALDPHLVVNAAAYTDVDECEKDREGAYRGNALGPRNLAVSCERHGCRLLQISTNYVFGGGNELPYEPFDSPCPISVYGATKLAGEEYVKDLCSRWYIVRTAGVYGRGHNFVRTMLRVADEHETLKVKDDEYICPTYARDFAQSLVELLREEMYGVYHLTNSGSCSWYEFAKEIFDLAGVEAKVLPVSASEYPMPASRPRNGRLASTGSPLLRHWRRALESYLLHDAK